MANQQAAQLGTAYQDLGRELSSDKLKVVGGYTLGRVIGEGTFGSVHLATHRLTGTRCAIKKIPKAMTAQLTREIHHHRRLHHLHIVHLYEIVATEGYIWLVTELCSGGELFDYLVERGRILEDEARRMFGELVVAVGWMHQRGVVHRDLKLENVLLDGELRVKLGDLGFAREYQRGRLMDTFCGTTGYASPEMLAGTKYLGVETDVWSLGVILYTILCGGLPFDDEDERVMRDLIQKGDYDEPEWLGEDARSLIRACLQHDPGQRPSIEAILKHPWFNTSPRIIPEVSPMTVHEPEMPPFVRHHSGEFSHVEQALEQRHEPLAHSRTPSRTKRRSVTSLFERRASSYLARPVDYPALLNREAPVLFSTPSEKYLLNQLSDLAFDTGQLMHSVESDACDTSAATWWILRAKQAERGETDEVINARVSAAAKRREQAAAYVREERQKARAEVSFEEPKVEPEVERRSPSKLVKQMTRSESAPLLETTPKKKESLWTTFRYLFEDKKKRQAAPQVILSRGIAARTPHVQRIPQSVSRRGSLDRPPYSRRSSSINSRRSSVNSMHLPELSDLGRRASLQSHGSQTPTSDLERPDSAHSKRRTSASLRSPSIDAGRKMPASPLHNYHRRPPSGSASTRIRHVKVVPERVGSPKVRDVFEDDDWEDEGLAGGLGQSGRARSKRKKKPEVEPPERRITTGRPPVVAEEDEEEL